MGVRGSNPLGSSPESFRDCRAVALAKADPFVRERQRGELRRGVPDAITMFPPQEDVFGLFVKGGGQNLARVDVHDLSFVFANSELQFTLINLDDLLVVMSTLGPTQPFFQ